MHAGSTEGNRNHAGKRLDSFDNRHHNCAPIGPSVIKSKLHPLTYCSTLTTGCTHKTATLQQLVPQMFIPQLLWRGGLIFLAQAYVLIKFLKCQNACSLYIPLNVYFFFFFGFLFSTLGVSVFVLARLPFSSQWVTCWPPSGLRLCHCGYYSAWWLWPWGVSLL